MSLELVGNVEENVGDWSELPSVSLSGDPKPRVSVDCTSRSIRSSEHALVHLLKSLAHFLSADAEDMSRLQ